MGRFFWIIEYFKVAAAYGFTMYVWPLVVFRGHLKEKSVTYRFLFCTLSMTTIITTLISFLGIFKRLSTPLVAVLFYGVFITRLLMLYNPFPQIRHTLRSFRRKTLTVKRLLLNTGLGLRDGVKELALMIWDGIKGKRMEYALLTIALLYGTIYFSYTSIVTHCYAASDQYVHHSWAYFLSEGNIYTNGIYPVGMHCILFVLSSLFGISLFSVNLYFSVIHMHAILLCAYLMMKEFYSFKYTPMFALFAYLTVGVPSGLSVGAMSRLTMTLPQEFGFSAMFISGYALLRFMKRSDMPDIEMPRRRVSSAKIAFKKLKTGRLAILFRPIEFKNKNLGRLAGLYDSVHSRLAGSERLSALFKPIRFRRPSFLPSMSRPIRFIYSVLADDDLRLFILAVSFTIMVHYYATIMAFFICIVIFITYIPKNLQWKRLLKITVAALLALFLAAAPTGVALARGYKFQGSIDWALSVGKSKKKTQSQETSSSGSDNGSKENDEDSAEDSSQESLAARKSLLTRTIDAAIEAPSKIKDTIQKHNAATFQTLYQGARGRWMRIVCLGVMTASLLIGASLKLTRSLARRLGIGDSGGRGAVRRFFLENGSHLGRLRLQSFVSYFCVASTLLVFMTAFKPKSVGLPVLVAGDRLCAVIELFAVMTYCCLPDFVISIIDGQIPVPDFVISSAAAVACLGIYIGMFFSGIYHGFLYCGLSRYPASVEITERIIQNTPQFKFTIVSPSEELYHIKDYGFHEEMIDFVQKRTNRTYTIPTPYIFFFLEKKPLQFGQILLPDGPKWLASDYYAKVFGYEYGHCSIDPDYLHGETSHELAAQKLPQVKLRSDYSMQLHAREIMESKAMEWYEAFSKAYPNEGTVIYEDEYFLCYCVRQNEFSLFTLGIMEES